MKMDAYFSNRLLFRVTVELFPSTE